MIKRRAPAPGTRSTWRGGILALTTLLLIAAQLPVQAAAAFPVTTTPLVSAPWQAQTHVLGEVRSRASQVLTAPAGGRVMGPFLPQGTNVKAGTRIARVMPPDLSARLDSATAQLRFAREALGHVRQLYAAQLKTRSELQAAQTRVTDAIDTLRSLRTEQDQLILTAPVSGTVHYQVVPGAVVTAGSPLARLSGDGTLWVRAFVPPSAVQPLKTGATASLRRGRDWHTRARITAIGRSARHDGLVEVFLQPTHTHALLAGEWLHVTLPAASGQAWRVPRRAVVMQGAQAHIYLLEHGRARAVNVTLVHSDAHAVWFTGPFHPGDHVIVTGAGQITDGTAVTVSVPTHSAPRP